MASIIIDTDGGLDDAGAILMLLEAHKKNILKIIAITTTHGNSALDNVNKNVLRVLDTVSLLGEVSKLFSLSSFEVPVRLFSCRIFISLSLVHCRCLY